MTGKEQRSNFKWGKFDWNDLWHLFIGGAIFFALYGTWIWMDLDRSLDAKYVALIGTFSLSFIWEYSQKWRNYKIAMDLKDIFVSCLIGIISVILL